VSGPKGIQRARFLAGCLFAGLLGCGKQEPPAPVIEIDGVWSTSFTKTVCENAERWHKESAADIRRIGCDALVACPEMMTLYAQCALNPAQSARDFETELVTHLAAYESCKSVRLFQRRRIGDAVAVPGQFWVLSIDYTPGREKQGWLMTRHVGPGVSLPSRRMRGEGDASQIAKKVCVILNEQGARLVN
jgi:hypothetical protein